MKPKVETVWATPDAENLLGYMARVSNLKAHKDDPSDRLIKYLVNHGHWSPFEMVNMCVKIETTRDVSRQILRHRSFSFQEFSGRYAEFPANYVSREFRLQDRTNRQNSIVTDEPKDEAWFAGLVEDVNEYSRAVYNEILARGGAKEVARSVLPEGLTPTVMYMSGTLRSWLHYVLVRTGPETQKEHRWVAQLVKLELIRNFPTMEKILEGLQSPVLGTS
jgi:thymidylate synthase (FAD)